MHLTGVMRRGILTMSLHPLLPAPRTRNEEEDTDM